MHTMSSETIRLSLRRAIDDATATLAEAGIASARWDAEQLAAHLAGVDRGRLGLLESPGQEFFQRYRDAVSARARRVPLQHLLGTAAFGPVLCTSDPGSSSRVPKPRRCWNGPPRNNFHRGPSSWTCAPGRAPWR